MEKLKAQEGEGCHMWGTLAVNKVRSPPCELMSVPGRGSRAPGCDRDSLHQPKKELLTLCRFLCVRGLP